ncbi:hypothetical protein ACHAQF_000350 [Verticillium nonalfalfae]
MNMRIFEAIPEQQPSFRLFIGITQFLDAVISQYRPHATPDCQSSTGKVHSFETLAQEADALDIGFSLLASLEMFYLSVVILQSRPHKGDKSPERVPLSALQIYSASSIVSVALGEFKTSMTYWAILPYAVSMATSVAYQSLRNSNVPYKRKQAYSTFHSSCDILEKLSISFRSACTMAKLANDTLQEVERVSGNRNRANQPSNSSRQSVARDGQATDQTTQTTSAAFEAKELEATQGTQLRRRPSAEASSVPVASAYTAPLPGQPSLDPSQMIMGTTPFDNMDFTDVPGIFEDFDPDFHLNRIDALFSATLDPTMSFMPDEWFQEGAFEEHH